MINGSMINHSHSHSHSDDLFILIGFAFMLFGISLCRQRNARDLCGVAVGSDNGELLT